MQKPASNLAAIRREGKTQVDARREAILDAAEKLFLQNGIPAAQMIDIAARAGITKISLYRYFPNRDAIALEIHKRMMDRIGERVFSGKDLAGNLAAGSLAAHSPAAGIPLAAASLEGAREIARAMIASFPALRDAYRYMGMFDHLYLDHPPENELAQQTKQLLSTFLFGHLPLASAGLPPAESSRILMALSAVIWFLEKLALRGELTWSDQAVPLEAHLQLFEEMVLGYLDRRLAEPTNEA